MSKKKDTATTEPMTLVHIIKAISDVIDELDVYTDERTRLGLSILPLLPVAKAHLKNARTEVVESLLESEIQAGNLKFPGITKQTKQT